MIGIEYMWGLPPWTSDVMRAVYVAVLPIFEWWYSVT